MNMTIEEVGVKVVTLSPMFSYTFSEKFFTKVSNRSLSGGLNTAVYSPTYTTYSLPLYCVTSSDMYYLNNWWSTSTTLRFYPDTTVSSDDYSNVFLSGEKAPINTFSKGYFSTDFSGTLLMETV